MICSWGFSPHLYNRQCAWISNFYCPYLLYVFGVAVLFYYKMTIQPWLNLVLLLRNLQLVTNLVYNKIYFQHTDADVQLSTMWWAMENWLVPTVLNGGPVLLSQPATLQVVWPLHLVQILPSLVKATSTLLQMKRYAKVRDTIHIPQVNIDGRGIQDRTIFHLSIPNKYHKSFGQKLSFD